MNDAIQPPPKKQRIAAYSAPDNSNDEQRQMKSSLYFDLLPENALDNIVRFRSRSPRALNWPNYTFLEDIHDLYDVAGELGRFLLGRFTGVYVHPDFPQDLLQDLYDIDLSGEWMILCTPEFLLTFIRSGRVIPSFESIFVGYMTPLDVVGNRNFDSLSRQWPNVRCLVFRDGLEGNWLETFGKDLESLYVLGTRAGSLTKMKISTYCAKLRHLHMKYVIWEGIDSALFWKKVGKHLESVCARFGLEGVGHIQHITKFCPGIKRLELRGNIDGIPECIASYGKQIEEAKIDFPAESDLKLLLSACPNARFSLWTKSKRDLRMTLDILGSKLKALEITPQGGHQFDELPVDWSSCTNLESVKFHTQPSIEDIRGLMEKPKSLLKCFQLLNFGPNDFKEEKLKEFISLLSGGTGALENLVLRCHEPSLGLFNSLVERNRKLSYVEINFPGHVPEVKKTDVKKTFRKCPSLKRLGIHEEYVFML